MNAVAEPPRHGWDPPPASPAPAPWQEAATAACLLAVDPCGLGGAVLRAAPGPVREAWLALLRRLLPAEAPMRRVPHSVPDSRLLGGLDMAATLQAGRAVAERGLLAEADGGLLLLAMAERLPAGTAARIAAVMDAREVAAERDGLALRAPARFGVVALDEGAAPEERPPGALAERLAFALALDAVHPREAAVVVPLAAAVPAARAALGAVRADDSVLEALCGTAMALGIASLRAPVLALRAACAAAALAGRAVVTEEDAALAARLVLAPRATCLPAPPESPEADAPPDPPPEPEQQQAEEEHDAPDPETLREMVLAADRKSVV